MNNTSSQITVRGLDRSTKIALDKKATENGLSLNKYAVQLLKQAVSVDMENRYKLLLDVIDRYPIPQQDVKLANQAIDEASNASMKKQKRDDRELSL